MPHEFRDAREVVKYLAKRRNTLSRWFLERTDVDRIPYDAVGANTFRAFHHLPQRPCDVFRGWANRAIRDDNAVRPILTARSQSEFDEYVRRFSERLRRAWRTQQGQVLAYGPSRKLPNLLLKHYARYERLSNGERTRLIEHLHVPLDSFTLIGIRNCVNEPRIPRNASMSYVQDEVVYNSIQAAIRDVAHRAEVPAIYFDVLAWNMGH